VKKAVFSNIGLFTAKINPCPYFDLNHTPYLDHCNKYPYAKLVQNYPNILKCSACLKSGKEKGDD
jgi:hypothetical protein